jgi:hypothetical protein
LSHAWARNLTFALVSYENALKVELNVASWMVLAQNAALGARIVICEGGPVLPKNRAHTLRRERKS